MSAKRPRLSTVADPIGCPQFGDSPTPAGTNQPDVEEYNKAASAYREDGVRRALKLGNRGPIVFDDNGKLNADILEKYWECGFYVFTDVLSAEELSDLQEGVRVMRDQAPVEKDSAVDRHGNPILHPEIYSWQRPLSDPLGGTAYGVFNFRGGKTEGRHHVKMTEPLPLPGSPTHVLEMIFSPLAHMDSFLRLYGHPELLRIAEAINGPDFTPFIETMMFKDARLGPSTAWHQDPSSAWDEDWRKPGFADNTCGFSFHVALSRNTAANGLWMIPGSHRGGRRDIKALVKHNGGSDMLPDAVPILCEPGDVYIQNRMALHGAFPNTSDESRVDLQFGFHCRASVLGIQTRGYDVDGKTAMKVYDDAFIHERSKMIAWAIDARRQRFPFETPYVYQPFARLQERYQWTPELKRDLYHRMCSPDNCISI